MAPDSKLGSAAGRLEKGFNCVAAGSGGWELGNRGNGSKGSDCVFFVGEGAGAQGSTVCGIGSKGFPGRERRLVLAGAVNGSDHSICKQQQSALTSEVSLESTSKQIYPRRGYQYVRRNSLSVHVCRFQQQLDAPR